MILFVPDEFSSTVSTSFGIYMPIIRIIRGVESRPAMTAMRIEEVPDFIDFNVRTIPEHFLLLNEPR